MAQWKFGIHLAKALLVVFALKCHKKSSKLHCVEDISLCIPSMPLVISGWCAPLTHANQQYQWAAIQEKSNNFNMYRTASRGIMANLRWMAWLLPNALWRRLVMNNWLMSFWNKQNIGEMLKYIHTGLLYVIICLKLYIYVQLLEWCVLLYLSAITT